MTAQPYVSKGCFGCGTENPRSLGIKPQLKDGWMVAEVTIPEDYRGFSKLVHGGITALLCDELMGMAVGAHLDGLAATVELNVQFRKPAFIDTPLTVKARYLEAEAKFHFAEARIETAEGKAITTANGKFYELSDKDTKKMFLGRSGRVRG